MMSKSIKFKSVTLVLDEEGYALEGGSEEARQELEQALSSVQFIESTTDGFIRGQVLVPLEKEQINLWYWREIENVLQEVEGGTDGKG